MSQLAAQRTSLSAPSACSSATRPRQRAAVVVQCSSRPAPGGAEPQPSTSRRQLLGALAAAPLLLEALQLSVPAAAAAAAAGPRFLTPEEQAAVDKAFSSTVPKIKAPVCLRLAFHDFGPYKDADGLGGTNASIQYELKRPENFGLNRGWSVMAATMEKLKGTAAEGRVSYADLIALAGAYAVRITGGPDIKVPVGRLDAEGGDPEGRMPAEDASAREQLELFSASGLSPREFMALCGSHTLGSKGYGDPLTFDNTYYKTLLQKPWADKKNAMNEHIGIPTDHVLPDDPTCLPLIQEYAADQALFFQDFADAYVKMTSLGAKWA